MARRRPTRIIHGVGSDLTWAGGVLDATLNIKVRPERGGAEVATRMLDTRVVQELVRILGGKHAKLGDKLASWRCPAKEQYATLLKLVPYLRVQRTAVRSVIKFRLTQLRGRRTALTDTMLSFRKRLRDDAVLAGTRLVGPGSKPARGDSTWWLVNDTIVHMGSKTDETGRRVWLRDRAEGRDE